MIYLSRSFFIFISFIHVYWFRLIHAQGDTLSEKSLNLDLLNEETNSFFNVKMYEFRQRELNELSIDHNKIIGILKDYLNILHKDYDKYEDLVKTLDQLQNDIQNKKKNKLLIENIYHALEDPQKIDTKRDKVKKMIDNLDQLMTSICSEINEYKLILLDEKDINKQFMKILNFDMNNLVSSYNIEHLYNLFEMDRTLLDKKVIYEWESLRKQLKTTFDWNIKNKEKKFYFYSLMKSKNGITIYDYILESNNNNNNKEKEMYDERNRDFDNDILRGIYENNEDNFNFFIDFFIKIQLYFEREFMIDVYKQTLSPTLFKDNSLKKSNLRLKN